MFSLGSKSSESQPHLLITPRIVTVNYSCFHMVNVSYMYMYNTAQSSSKKSFFHFPHVIKCCSNATIFFTSSCSLTVSTGMSEFSCLVNRIHTQRTKFHTDFPQFTKHTTYMYLPYHPTTIASSFQAPTQLYNQGLLIVGTISEHSRD